MSESPQTDLPSRILTELGGIPKRGTVHQFAHRLGVEADEFEMALEQLVQDGLAKVDKSVFDRFLPCITPLRRAA